MDPLPSIPDNVAAQDRADERFRPVQQDDNPPPLMMPPPPPPPPQVIVTEKRGGNGCLWTVVVMMGLAMLALIAVVLMVARSGTKPAAVTDETKKAEATQPLTADQTIKHISSYF